MTTNTGKRLSGERRQMALDAFDRHGTIEGAHRETGITCRAIRRCVRERDGGGRREVVAPIVRELMAEGRTPEHATPEAPVDREYAHKEDGETAQVEYTSDKRIRTLEDALEYAEVDLTVWRVDRWETVSWEVGMKIRSFDRGKVTHEQPIKKNLWRVKLYLKRILPKALQEATEAIFGRMGQHSYAYPKAPASLPPSDPHMLEIDIFDHHFGKLGWEPESGTHYDLRIAERLYKNAVDDLVARVSGYSIDRICFPLGNDFMHIDNLESKTTAGTPQDCDGRYAKIYETAEMAFIWAVERLLPIAPVEVIQVSGNHDMTVSYHLARTVAAWFRSSDRVKVDCSPKSRKYMRYGTNLIGFSHGNEERHSDLPTLMAIEEPQHWAETTDREWHLGYYHKPKRTETITSEEKKGVEIRVLSSLSGTDSWHYKRGLVGGTRAAECYLWSFRNGYCGHFRANARLD